MPDVLQFSLLFEPAPEHTAEPEQSRPPDQQATPEPQSDAPGPPDRDARHRALDVRRSAIVEAPAGSGKTGLLLQRYLKLLSAGGVSEPEEVLAITFTRKATAELRERVLEQLHAAAERRPLAAGASSFERETRALAEAALAEDDRRGWRLIEQPQRLRIRTIDAVCVEIARTLPLLSGLGASEPVDSADSMYREAARRTLLDLGGPDAGLTAALETVLLHRDASLGDCEMLLARMLEQRQQWGDLIPLDSSSLTDAFLNHEVRPRLERSLAATVEAGLARVVDAVPQPELVELAELASELARDLPPDSPIALCADRGAPPAAGSTDLAHWKALLCLLFTQEGNWRQSFSRRTFGGAIPREQCQRLQQLIGRIQSDGLAERLLSLRKLPQPCYPDTQWNVAKALFRLLRHALAHLKVHFAEKGRCDFVEFAIAACTALAAEGGAQDLARSPGARLTHLLVDEMQDTSSSQYTLLELLTRSWDGHSQTIFLVGDPKQSIYLFRQARVERFLRTVEQRRLGDVPLQALRLTANFRSQRTLVDSLNSCFSEIFPAFAGAPGTIDATPEVPFVRADAVREAAPQGPALVWHARRIDEHEAPATHDAPPIHREDDAQQEAREIRQIIERWRARPLPDGRTRPWSIAVLARARRHLTAITAEFAREEGNGPIPFRAVEIVALNERPEVLDALALTRALLHPADRGAWLAALRAPWCGLLSADLLCLTGEGPESDSHAPVAELIAARSGHLSEDGQRRLARAWPVLEAAYRNAGRSSLAVHVERTWRSLGGDAPLSPQQLANVRRFFDVLHEVERNGDGYVDLALLSARVACLHADTAEADEAVQLLTIHNSKGLEFDVVLIPAMNGSAPPNRPELLDWLEVDADGSAAHVLLSPVGSKGDSAGELSQWVTRAKSMREASELRRLFYVACTRAREELHLFAACQTSRDGTLRTPRGGTLLRAAWPVAAAQFSVVEASSTAETGTLPARSNALASVIQFPPRTSADHSLALAAAADEADPPRSLPIVHRLPQDFHPLSRFQPSAADPLPLAPANLPTPPAADRPEGSFAVRAFGNVVHRFLQFISTRLADGATSDSLLAELDTWQPRVTAALRNEGLAPAAAQRETPRALAALRNALTDPVGRWILSPHPSAASEFAFSSAAAALRADRTFVAGSEPLSQAADCTWIIDFKTAELGSRTPESFQQEELLKYREQLERYARALVELTPERRPVLLGLYYPMIPLLMHWQF